MKCLIAVLLSIAAASAVPLEKVSNGSNRIINGSPAKAGQFPWQVAIYMWDATGQKTLCGGSLISNEWVLTAGHCAKDISVFYLNLGTTKLSEPQVATTVIQAIVHPEYTLHPIGHDIAVLKLASPVVLSDTVQIIPLANSSLGADVPVTISGWGQTDANVVITSDNLNYLELSTISNDDCLKTFSPTLVQDGVVCCNAGKDPVTSPCHGDSGGPLVTGEGSNAVQVAIASFVSSNGCDAGDPSAYTRVAYYREWIREQTGV